MMDRRILLAGGAVAALALAAAQLGNAAGYEVKAMTPAQISDSGALVVDIRGADEWAATGVIEGAKLMTFTNPDSFLAAFADDLADGRDLVLVCQSGRRSAAAAQALVGKMSNKIISLDGGMSGVVAGGYQTVAPQ